MRRALRSRPSSWLWILAAGAAAGCGSQKELRAPLCGESPGGEPAPGYQVYAGLCDGTLDGSLFRDGLVERHVRNGALELQVTGANLESARARGVRPGSALAASGSGASRITSWQATVAVPDAAAATRIGSATIQASVALVYQPVATRLQFPGGSAKNVSAQLGLQDTGTGLRFYRSVVLCSDAACATTDAATGIAYDDGTLPVGQPASTGTPYTLSVSLDEATGTFSFAVSGGGLATTRTGTATAAALFAAQGVDPARDFSHAMLRVRAFDPAAGGSAGSLRATFDDVQRGVAGGAPALFDDFAEGTIDWARWLTGEGSASLHAGALELRPSITGTTFASASTGVAVNPSALPPGTNRVRVDVAIAASTRATVGSETSFTLTRALYNDGSAYAAPDVNQPDSPVGDVVAAIRLSPGSASAYLMRGLRASGAYELLSGMIELPASAAHPLAVGTVHTLELAWDPAAHMVTFRLDDADPLRVDPTSAADPHVSKPAPVSKPRPNAERTTLSGGVSLSVPAGTQPAGLTTEATFRVNNLLYAP